MSVFLWAATAGSPSGYFLFSPVAQNRGWRDVFWALLGLCSGVWLILLATLRETRHSTLLRRRAARERKQTGNDAIEVPDTLKRRGGREYYRTRSCGLLVPLHGSNHCVRYTIQWIPVWTELSLRQCLCLGFRIRRPWIWCHWGWAFFFRHLCRHYLEGHHQYLAGAVSSNGTYKSRQQKCA